jgi:outer membrane protein
VQHITITRSFIAALCIMFAACAIARLPAQGSTTLDPSGLPIVTAAISLSDAIGLADQDNATIEQARADEASARATALQSAAASGPGISTTTYATSGDSPNVLASSQGVAPANIFAVPTGAFVDQNLMLMAPLTTGGVLRYRNASANAAASAAQSTLAASALTTQNAVAEAYAGVLSQNAIIVAAQSRLTAEQEEVRITSEKVTDGRLAPADLVREQAELADAQQAETQAEVGEELAFVDLKAALGVSQESDIQVTDTLDSLASALTRTIPGTLADAIELAARNRPELAAAEQNARAANADVSAARGEYAPQIYGVAMADAMSGSSDGYTVGLTASMPIYDSGGRRADVDAAKAKLDHAEADARAAAAAVESQVAQAWYSLQSGRQQVTTAQAGLAAAQQAYDLANLRYDAGKSTTSDRLDALAALTRARAELVQAQTTLVVSESEFDSAVGDQHEPVARP